MLNVDLRHLLPAVRAPALLVHRSGAGLVPAESVRWLAAALPDARVVELDGSDLAAFFGDTDLLMDEIEDFLGGTRTGSDADRSVLTMLVTDVVGSTEQAARLGDRRWDELLAWHHREVRALLARHGGQEVDTAGDGFLAVFDLPSRALTCALAIRDRLADGGLTVRAGLHAGEVVRGPQGVRGVAVHVAARVAATATPGQVRTVGPSGVGVSVRWAVQVHAPPSPSRTAPMTSCHWSSRSAARRGLAGFDEQGPCPAASWAGVRDAQLARCAGHGSRGCGAEPGRSGSPRRRWSRRPRSGRGDRPQRRHQRVLTRGGAHRPQR